MGFIRNYFARRKIKGLFGTYITPTLVEQMAIADKTTQVGAQEREITAFFCSIDSYVSLAEQLPLAQLPGLMDGYFTACTTAICAEGGTLDKFIGDMVVAMFGAPVHLPDHALRACVSALKTQNEISSLREKFRREEGTWPEIAHGLRVRIGLNTGAAIIGNMGTATRFNYTMMGDEVNLAARMESGAKSWGVWTLCTGKTKQACDQTQKGRVVFRSLGPIIAIGRTQPVELFELVALSEDVTDDLRECVSLFGSGLARYLAQDWDGAKALFHRSAELEDNQPGKSPGVRTNPSLVFLGLCDYLRANPPGSAWRGVYMMK